MENNFCDYFLVYSKYLLYLCIVYLPPLILSNRPKGFTYICEHSCTVPVMGSVSCGRDRQQGGVRFFIHCLTTTIMTQTKENRERVNTVSTEISKYKDECRQRIEELSKVYSCTEASEMGVSKRTARWVELYKETNKLWGDISDLCECDNPSCDIDDICDKHLATTLGVLQDFLLDRIKWSVYENIAGAYPKPALL